MQIHSAIPEIFDSQTKTKEVTDSAKNRTRRSLLRAITIILQPLYMSTPVSQHLQSSRSRGFC